MLNTVMYLMQHCGWYPVVNPTTLNVMQHCGWYPVVNPTTLNAVVKMCRFFTAYHY